ncbi:MAG: fused MFS/spermidine synthase [Rhodospirillales bacterium]|nr:fused MFS/spermidine synthase [Rhodospirillales bacterium]MCB9996848.1 fused MFS/spermidine synthase [Rhodospirillales bacterium]
MTSIRSLSAPALTIHVLVLISGMAALSWELIWQVKSTLALGVSAWGTALTLAVTMGGMCLGALIMGRFLDHKPAARPIRIYGLLELAIGLSGLLLGTAFRYVEQLDSWVYASAAGLASLAHITGIALSLGIPTMAMGATLPILGLMARQFKGSIAVLYGLNTFGAALGVMIAAFFWIPLFGVAHVILLIAGLNILAGLAALWLGRQMPSMPAEPPEEKIISAPENRLDTKAAALIVFATGFATFMLEVAWFRSMTAAFLSTTSAFAVMLACVLVALAIGAWFAPFLKKHKKALGVLVCWAGVLIIATTPIVERFDLFMHYATTFPVFLFTRWFFLSLYIIGPAVILLGVALPWILDDQTSTRKWGALYGLNAFASILGSLCAGWLLLPSIGFAKTAWIAGIIVIAAGMLILPKSSRTKFLALSFAALAAAFLFESGIGKKRVQGTATISDGSIVLRAYDGPDATVSAIEHGDGVRLLYIDGFVTTLQTKGSDKGVDDHYMPWMGYLPMMAHPDPERALVICFGTGQTANAVRKEAPDALDIVDINENVFRLAEYFPANEGVLQDQRVTPIAMDGRAYLRRTKETYDVITLEPMPPHFAGVNALYSREFYEQARQKMTPDGVIAQWLPFHIVPPYYSASIARTFQSVFPNAILWVDPSSTGILLGSADDNADLGNSWPGFKRAFTGYDLSAAEVSRAVLLDKDELAAYGKEGDLITDDNQLLAYGKAAYQFHGLKGTYNKNNFALISGIKAFSWDDIWEADTPHIELEQ